MPNLTSSFLESCEYNEFDETLTIKFKNGKEYNYYDVPKDIYEAFIAADSAGTYYSAYIKGKFEEMK